MGRMKNYYEFSQLIRELETETLLIMARAESDEYKRQLIEWELEGRTESNEHTRDLYAYEVEPRKC
jgi:hypothetical protein